MEVEKPKETKDESKSNLFSNKTSSNLFTNLDDDDDDIFKIDLTTPKITQSVPVKPVDKQKEVKPIKPSTNLFSDFDDEDDIFSIKSKPKQKEPQVEKKKETKPPIKCKFPKAKILNWKKLYFLIYF